MPSARRWVTQQDHRGSPPWSVCSPRGSAWARPTPPPPPQGTVSDTSHHGDLVRRPLRRPERHRRRPGPAGLHACRSPATTSRCTSSTPPGYGSTHTLNVKVAWAEHRRRLRRLRPRPGRQRRRHLGLQRRPRAGRRCPRTAGDYTVRVVPYAPLGAVLQRDRDAGHGAGQPGPGHRHPAGFTNYAAPSTLHRREQRRRAVDRHQLQDRLDDVPVLPVHLQGRRSTTAPRRRRRPGPTSSAKRRQRLPAGQHGRASTRSCSPTTRPAARSSRSSPASTR